MDIKGFVLVSKMILLPADKKKYLPYLVGNMVQVVNYNEENLDQGFLVVIGVPSETKPKEMDAVLIQLKKDDVLALWPFGVMDGYLYPTDIKDFTERLNFSAGIREHAREGKVKEQLEYIMSRYPRYNRKFEAGDYFINGKERFYQEIPQANPNK